MVESSNRPAGKGNPVVESVKMDCWFRLPAGHIIKECPGFEHDKIIQAGQK
jgi:hypothetical protein